MSTLGLIGSGKVGGTVARLAVAAGHEVVLSNSRGPDTLADLVAELGPRARAATAVEAAGSGDIVVVTIPFGPTSVSCSARRPYPTSTTRSRRCCSPPSPASSTATSAYGG